MGPRAKIIVCDTNVLISALGWRGPERRIYEMVRRNEVRMATSPELLDELMRVLAYPKLGFSADEAHRFLADASTNATVVLPEIRLHVVKADPDDDRVLECAVAAGATLIVSGDKHLIALGEYSGITICPAQRALSLLTT